MNPDRNRQRRRLLLGLSSFVAVLLVCVAVGQARSWTAYSIASRSMAPTLALGDSVVVRNATGESPRRGEIWAFTMPPASSIAGSVAVKRVVGLPGETVAIHDGTVFIDDEPLDEPYLVVFPDYDYGPTTLGPNEYFVLGDQRTNSLDGHIWGPLPAQFLIGPVRYRYWPPDRARGL